MTGFNDDDSARRCSSCGAPFEHDARFCGACGSRIPPLKQSPRHRVIGVRRGIVGFPVLRRVWAGHGWATIDRASLRQAAGVMRHGGGAHAASPVCGTPAAVDVRSCGSCALESTVTTNFGMWPFPDGVHWSRAPRIDAVDVNNQIESVSALGQGLAAVGGEARTNAPKVVAVWIGVNRVIPLQRVLTWRAGS